MGLDAPDQVLRVPDRQRGLAGDRDAVSGQLERVDVFGLLHQVYLAGRLAHHAFRLRVALAADVDHLVALARQVGHQFVRAHHVRAGGVDRLQAKLDCASLHLGRHAVGGEDDRAFPDVLEAGEPVRLIDQGDPLRLEVIGGVRVVNEHAEHVHGPLCLLADPPGDPERVHDAVAVPARRDLQDFHRTASSLRGRP